MHELVESKGILELCWKYLILGVLQGLTEFLPISSTAHLKVIPMLLGWGDPGVSLTAVIQLGSVFAVVIYFWNDLKKVLQGIFRSIKNRTWQSSEARLGLALLLGSLPIVVCGLAIKVFWPNYETSLLRSIPFIACISIVMGLLLAFADRMGARKKYLYMVRGRDGLLVGIWQVLALIPGVSRSGVTLTASLLDGWNKKDAARFSFLLGVPAITLAGILELKNAIALNVSQLGLPVLVGILSAAIVSWLSIDWLIKYLQRNSVLLFVIYRIVFGIILLVIWPILVTN